jgi:hypothetical protein
MSTTPTLAEVVGNNAKRIRGTATLEQMAKAAKYYGLPWTIGRVGSFESGKVSPRLDTLIAVCAALRTITGDAVTLPDLVRVGPRRVAVSPRITMNLAKLQGALSAEPIKIAAADLTGEKERLEALGAATEADFRSWQPALQHVDLALRVRVLDAFTEGDHEVARSLEISPIHAAAAMARSWGRTFVAERNKRAGADANAQRRGHISRELKAELRKVIDGDD